MQIKNEFQTNTWRNSNQKKLKNKKYVPVQQHQSTNHSDTTLRKVQIVRVDPINEPKPPLKPSKSQFYTMQFPNLPPLPPIHTTTNFSNQNHEWPYTYTHKPDFQFNLSSRSSTQITSSNQVLQYYYCHPYYYHYGQHGFQCCAKHAAYNQRPRKEVKKLSCYNCGESGHLGNDCTKPTMEELLAAELHILNFDGPESSAEESM